jgi:hypothetical protein
MRLEMPNAFRELSAVVTIHFSDDGTLHDPIVAQSQGILTLSLDLENVTTIDVPGHIKHPSRSTQTT